MLRTQKTNASAEVRKALGLTPGKSLKEATPEEVRRVLDPYSQFPYPVSQAGDLTRVPREYVENWINVRKLAAQIAKLAPVATALEKVPREQRETVLHTALFEALNKRGSQAFFEEWQNPEAKKEIARIIGVSAGKPKEANDQNAPYAVEQLRTSIARRGNATLVDLGPGSGATIAPILDFLKPEERRKVTVVLVDAMKEAIDEKAMRNAIKSGKVIADLPSAEKVAKEYGVKDVVSIQSAFDDLEQHPDFGSLEGTADIVVSGAAIHHNQSVDGTFRAAAKLLRRGGKLAIWDWGHAAWKAQNLLVAPADAQISPSGKTYVDPRTKEIVTAPKDHAFVAQTPKRSGTPAELAGVKEILTTWTGGTDEKGGLLKYGPEHSQKLMTYMRQRIAAGKPVNFLEFLNENLVGQKRLNRPGAQDEETPTPYLFLEGHRPPELYEQSIKRAGLTHEETRYVPGSNLLYIIRAVKKE